MAASHFVEALRFLCAVAGLRHMPLERVLSSSILGVARDIYLDKRPLAQKPQLTVDMVEKLEKFCPGVQETEGLSFRNFALPAWSDRTGSWANAAMSLARLQTFSETTSSRWG